MAIFEEFGLFSLRKDRYILSADCPGLWRFQRAETTKGTFSTQDSQGKTQCNVLLFGRQIVHVDPQKKLRRVVIPEEPHLYCKRSSRYHPS